MLEQQYERECRRKIAYIAVGLVMIVFFAFAFSVIGMDVQVFLSVVALKALYTGNINDGTYAAANKIIVLLLYLFIFYFTLQHNNRIKK